MCSPRLPKPLSTLNKDKAQNLSPPQRQIASTKLQQQTMPNERCSMPIKSWLSVAIAFAHEFECHRWVDLRNGSKSSKGPQLIRAA